MTSRTDRKRVLQPGHGERPNRGVVVLITSTLMAALTAVVAPAASAAPAVYVVTSTGDEGDAAAQASCAGGGGACTLRAAILEANTHPNDPAGPDQIRFALPGSGPHSIAASSSLPPITDPVSLDAGLPPALAPRQVELTGGDCFSNTSLPCEGIVIHASSTTVRGLAINGFFSSIRASAPSGVDVLTDVVVEGNFLGTNAAGDALAPHSTLDLDFGLQLYNVAQSRVGGDPALGEGNVIAGFHWQQIEGAAVSTTRFLGNRLGTNPAGTAGLGGGGHGIVLSGGEENVFGEPGAGNVISGLSEPTRRGGSHGGIILNATEDNLIQSNRIGVNAAGDSVLPNTGAGISVHASRTVIGGSPAAANVISGNSTGIVASPSQNASAEMPSANEISFNRVGTDASGERALGNLGEGIAATGRANHIHHNVIAGNGAPDQRANGLTLFNQSPDTLVENNWIGVTPTGSPMGNTGFGILVRDDPFAGGGSIIGGSAATGNHIAHNGQAGVVVGGSRFAEAGNPPGNTIRGNSIHDNGDPSPAVGLGIDLHTAGHNSGPDPIDPLDADTGANEQQNAPEITDVTITDGRAVVTGRLHSTPGESFILDLYANSACDATGYGEGERWLTSTTLTTAPTDAADPGTAPFTITLDEVLHAPDAVAATATNSNGSTSEFSACATAPPEPPAPSRTRTTYTGPRSMVYSDPATFSGTLEDVSGTPVVGIPDKELEFKLGEMATVAGSPTGSDGAASAPPTPVTLTPGPATIDTTFAGAGGFLASSDSDQVQVTREDCKLSYTGDTLVPPLTATRLTAQFGESDAYPGIWTGKLVTFEVVDTSLRTRTYTATTNEAGTATLTAPLNADVYAVTASFAGDAFYSPCATPVETLVTVAAAGSKVTGGGWFSNTAGRTNFGFNAIPQTDGTFKGQLQVRATTQKSTFHGANVTGLTSLSRTSVQWAGTGQWNGMPGYTFLVSAVDNGSSGSKKGDTISLVIYPTGSPAAPVFSSNGHQMLRGGNLTVQ